MNEIDDSEITEERVTLIGYVLSAITVSVTVIGEFVHVCMDIILSPLYVLIDRINARVRSYKARKAFKNFERTKHTDDLIKRAQSGKYSVRVHPEQEKGEIKE